MTVTADTTELARLIGDRLDALVAFRRDLHAHPELAYAEWRTSERVQERLAEAGIEFRSDLAGGTGILAHLPGEGDRSIGLRADMDALPIEEETDVAWCSTTPGCMHACGHDGHTTILLGTALVLAEIARHRPLPRPVHFCFQPAEEGGAGGRRMVEDGCLAGTILGPPVETMFGLHGWPRFPLGHVGSRPGPLLAAADMFEVSVRGVGSHAAMPHYGHDPIVATSAIVTALQSIVSRTVDPLDSAVVSVTAVHGGTTHNVLPDGVELKGTVRTLRSETKRLVRDRLQQVVERTADAHGCSAEVRYHDGYPVTRNDEGATATFFAAARAMVGEDRVITVPHPHMGGEDFSYYGQVVPACFFLLGLRGPEVDAMPDLHQPRFDFNDAAIPTGIELFCRLALGLS